MYFSQILHQKVRSTSRQLHKRMKTLASQGFFVLYTFLMFCKKLIINVNWEVDGGEDAVF